MPAGRVAVPGERDRRSEYLGKRQLSQASVRFAQSGNRARHGDRAISFQVFVVDDTGPAEVADCGLSGQLVHVGSDGQRTFHWEADNTALVTDLIYQIATAADSAGCGFDDSNGEAGRDRGVNGVPAVLQHGDAGHRCVNVLGRDHAFGGAGLGLCYRGERGGVHGSLRVGG